MTHPPRLASLDAFRGFAIAAMVLVNNPGSWGHIYAPLDHAKWNGCTFTDLIFPFFLFAAGLAMTISLGRKAQQGTDRPALLLGILRRASIIFLIGVGLNLIPAFDLSTVRIPGVLQRIALTVMLAAPIVLWGRWTAAVVAIAGLCGLYLLVMLLVPVAGADGIVAAGRLQPGLDFGSWLDRLVLGRHLWASARTWDPEGIVSTLPATASLLFGVLAGRYLASPAPAPVRKSLRLLLAGLLLLGLGAGLNAAFLPINKNLWTPSFAVFTAGWSLLFLAAFHAALDEAPPRLLAVARRVCLPLTIYGMNALFLFVFSGVVARLLQTVQVGTGAARMTLKARAFGAIAAFPLSGENASLAFAVLFNLATFAVAWAMWRKQWFVKV
jgi:predicted acyltransferase